MRFVDPSPADLRVFRDPRLRFSVSGRDIERDVTVSAYLQAFFPYIGREQIESVYGFVDTRVPLYGGRVFEAEKAMHAGHRAELDALGIRLSLPMTNHFFDRAAYEASRVVLAAHHREGNSVIMINDEFARQVRQDFPLYTRKASVIKKLLSPEAVERALELYDMLVLPAEKNDDVEFLVGLEPKERIQIFAVAGCDYNCPARVCYPSISRINRGEIALQDYDCSRPRLARDVHGTVFFDVSRFAEMGYRSFKLLKDSRTRPAAFVIARKLSQLSARKAAPANPVGTSESFVGV